MPHRSARTLRRLALAAVLAATTIANASPAPGTIRVGKETKKTTGVLRTLESGDVACYATFADERGVEFTEMAEFEICEMTALVGKRVALTYTTGKVIADECQGDPECTRTRTVALVNGMKAAPSQAKPQPAARPVTRADAAPTSFCTATETVVFSCRTGAKLVSVCASKNASRTRGYVQYRFGKPGAALELVLPADQRVPPRAATGETVPFSGGGGSWLRFTNAPYAYVVYSGIGKWGPRGETQEKQGVVVERDGKVLSHLKCTGPLTSRLEMPWFEAVGIAAGGQDFLFPD